MNRNLKKPKINEKSYKFKNMLGVKLTTLITMLGIPWLAHSSVTVPSQIEQNTNAEITIGVLKDIPDDKYKNCIPLYADSAKKNVTAKLKNGSLVFFNEDSSNNSFNVYAIDDFNNSTTGYISNEYLSSHKTLDTSKYNSVYIVREDNGINLRSSAEVKSENKISTIPNNSILIGTIREDKTDNKWTQVLYTNGKSITEGYVSGEFLEKIGTITKDGKILERQNINYTVENDNVLGIDVSYMEPDMLKKLVTGQAKIPNVVSTIKGSKIDVSYFKQRKPNFVIIKLGASKIFSKDIEPSYNENYQRLAEVCEKARIPYGFYYYSTCTNNEEAKKEAECILKGINELGERDYHLLPFTIDVEAHSEKDRHYNRSVKEVTSSKAELANLLEAKLGKTKLYTGRNACDPSLASCFLDIDQYQSLLKSGPSALWFVSPLKSKIHAKSLEKFSKYITSKQIILDAKVGNNPNNLIDVNVINSEAFNNYINGTYQSKAYDNNSLVLAEFRAKYTNSNKNSLER